MYPVAENFNIYILLGFAGVERDWKDSWDAWDMSENGFSWGLGTSYGFTDALSVFVDFTRLFDDEIGYIDEKVPYVTTINTWNFGLTYKF